MFATIRNTVMAALLLLGASAAQATPITYDFTVTGTTGPLTGTVANGSLSYDSSSITPGAINAATGLLTALSFSWNGVTYSQTTANTGSLGFDASGNFLGAFFGSSCVAGSCSLTFATTGFVLVAAPNPVSGFFSYTVAGGTRSFDGTVTTALAAPEPATLALLGLGSGLVGLVRRTRRAEMLMLDPPVLAAGRDQARLERATTLPAPLP